MNLLRAKILLLILPALLSTSDSVMAQKKDTAVEKFAEALGDLLKGAVGKKEPGPAQPAMVAEAFQPALPEPAEDELKKREERLTAYTKAMVDWIAHAAELSEEDTARVAKHLADEVAASQKKWKPDPNQQPLHDTFPVKFTIRYGTAQDLDVTRKLRKLTEILSEDQLDRLSAAAEERTAFHLDATVERVLNLLDEQLFLTAAQREEMFPSLRETLDGMESSSFTFTPQSYYYKQTAVSFLLRRGDHLKCLNDAQRTRAKDFQGTTANPDYGVGSEQYLMFSSSEGMNTWHEKLQEACVAQRKRVDRACAVRAAYAMAELGLSEDDARHLKVAGKGVAENLVSAWKKTTRQQLKTYEEQAGRFGGNFSFSMQMPDLNKIETDPIWEHTLEKLPLKPSKSGPNREDAIRKSGAIFLTSLLDKELWLLPDQRTEVQALIEKTLPTSNTANVYRNYMDEVALLVIPLFKFSKQDATVFKGAQKDAWESLKKEFDFNGRYVQVLLKNGGSFHFQIPK